MIIGHNRNGRPIYAGIVKQPYPLNSKEGRLNSELSHEYRSYDARKTVYGHRLELMPYTTDDITEYLSNLKKEHEETVTRLKNELKEFYKPTIKPIYKGKYICQNTRHKLMDLHDKEIKGFGETVQEAYEDWYNQMIHSGRTHV